MKLNAIALSLTFVIVAFYPAADNTLSDAERADGWILLFDGKTFEGWMTSSRTPSRTPIHKNGPRGRGATRTECM